MMLGTATPTSNGLQQSRPVVPSPTVMLYLGWTSVWLLLTTVCVTPQHIDAADPAISGTEGSLSDVMFRAVWKGYEKSVRPLCGGGGYPYTTAVRMGMALRQLQQLDEPKQILSTNVWLRLRWNDCRLTWNVSYWNVTRLVVPYDVMWTPDLTLYDNAESGLSGMDKYRLLVSWDGNVTQFVPLVLNSVCQLDVSRFPFDTQVCNLTFGSWSYNGLELNLSMLLSDAVDLESFVTHGEWKVAGLTAIRIEPYYWGVPYPQVIFRLELKRRHLFYVLSVLFPYALIQLMAALAFLLPCETNEKVGLELTVLLSMAVMQLVIMDMIPASSETLPIIGLYFTMAMITVSVACMMTVVVLAVHYPNRHRPLPPWAKSILRSRLAKLLAIDLKAELRNIKRNDAKANSYVTLEPSTSHDSTHQQKSHLPQQTQRSNKRRDENHVMSREVQPDVINHHDVTFDGSFVSYSYSVEGERGKRHTYRPRSADASVMSERDDYRDPSPWLHQRRWTTPPLEESPRERKLSETSQQQQRQQQQPTRWATLERGDASDPTREGTTDRGNHVDRASTERPRRPKSWQTKLGESVGDNEEEQQKRQQLSRNGPRDPLVEGEGGGHPLEPLGTVCQRSESSEEISLRRKPAQDRKNQRQENERETARKAKGEERRGEKRQEMEMAADHHLHHDHHPRMRKTRKRTPPPVTAESPPADGASACRHPHPEMWIVVDLCRKMLDCMQSDKKSCGFGGGGGWGSEKTSRKLDRREWQLMAEFLDRVFLLVFTLLTVCIFTYVYASIV